MSKNHKPWALYYTPLLNYYDRINPAKGLDRFFMTYESEFETRKLVWYARLPDDIEPFYWGA